METIILPLRRSSVTDWLLGCGISLARRFQAHLEVLHVSPEPDAMIPYATLGLSTRMRREILEAAERSAATENDALAERVARACEAAGIDRVPGLAQAPRGAASVSWNTLTGRRDVLVSRRARAFDLVVVPRPGRVSPPPMTFEAVLRETGRPVLMLPPGIPVEGIGERVLFGWNASREAARALAAALPCLSSSSSVTIWTSRKRAAEQPPPGDVVHYLRLHGIASEVDMTGPGRRPVGQAILASAAEREANLIVVGGYSRNRLRDMVMGGVTRHLLAHADRPVLLVH